MSYFVYPPSPGVLQGLAEGQLANRFHRAARLWVILTGLYGQFLHPLQELEDEFGYSQLRDLLFSSYHSKDDTLSAAQLQTSCGDLSCICHQPMYTLIFNAATQQSVAEWCQAVRRLTGIQESELQRLLQLPPFATVHRSIRDDLKRLVKMGWLQALDRSRYCRQSCHLWPKLLSDGNPLFSEGVPWHLDVLNADQLKELSGVLESISFVQPNLEVVSNALWEYFSDSAAPHRLNPEPIQRTFIHLDYILSEEKQDQVDDYQNDLEELWRHPPVAMVKFNYWIASEERQATVIVYPVCLHYCRRAKYLSAYGLDPSGEINWHNYRLDRIMSKKIKPLALGDPLIPKQLQILRHTGKLPLPSDVRQQLDAAWGFNFYLPKELLIMRFPAKFARWYVDDTKRHETFKPIAYADLPQLVRQFVAAPQQKPLLKLIKQCSPDDKYYQAWIRQGDTNVIMRLREWRPNGEVLAPLSVRERLKEEALLELEQYNKH